MSDSMTLEDYLAQGGQLTSPGNVPPRYRGELMRIMASFVDSELAGSAGFAGVINDSPGVKQRIAAARIVLEKADHAARVLRIMSEFGVDAEYYAVHHPWAKRLPRDASVDAAREATDMRLPVFHFPFLGWADAVVMNVLMGEAVAVQIGDLSRMSYAPLADVFRTIAPREARHALLGYEGLTQIVATGEGRAAARASIDYWRPRVLMSFGNTSDERLAMLKRFGLRHETPAAQIQRWNAQIDARLASLALA
ncbi:MAG: phenylacetate-CoA oxygenase subunit PaaI [Hyphomicrobiales bacterium]|nr:phenylacetate-CoA oxygenase subunit PaaI [Hyphomicrobiales bacterium]